MISVIVPVYNVEKYLRKCLDSIINQTYNDWELILVDDGSKDASREICDEYSQNDSRIKVFHKPNGGVSSARNIGIENACGEWIAFVDADDWLDPQYLLSLVNVKGAEMIVCGYKVDEDIIHDITRDDFVIDTQNCDYSQNYFNETFFFPWRRLYRRDIVQKYSIRFEEKLKLSEDTCFICEYLLYCNKIAYIKDSYYHHRSEVALGKYQLSCESFLFYTNALNISFARLLEEKGLNTDKIYNDFKKIFFAYYYDYLKQISNKTDFVIQTEHWNKNNVFPYLNSLFNSRIKSIFITYMIKFPLLGYYFFKFKKQ